MDKEKILDLILDIDLLYKYSEFIPSSYKSTYEQSLNNIKSQLKNLTDLNTNNLEQLDNIDKEENIGQTVIFLENNYTKIFEDVLDCILVTDTNNNTLSLNELLKNQSNSFLDFIDYYQKLESNKEIKFSKSKIDIPNRGWIKTGEILINSGLIDLDSLKKSIEYQNNKDGLFLGEAMIEFKLLNENNLRKALKAQRWIFKICGEISK